MTWIALKDRLPEGDKCVLLYPVISDVGILYITSNADYARGKYALEAGFTHWKEFEPHPDEEKQYEYNARLYEDDK